MIRKKDLPDCPVATTLSLLNSKWKVYIIQKLLERPFRHNELKKSLKEISQKVLTDSLRSMEADGLIERKVFDEKPPHVEYSLSELGLEMKSILDSLYNFGLKYKQRVQPNAGRSFASCQ